MPVRYMNEAIAVGWYRNVHWQTRHIAKHAVQRLLTNYRDQLDTATVQLEAIAQTIDTMSGDRSAAVTDNLDTITQCGHHYQRRLTVLRRTITELEEDAAWFATAVEVPDNVHTALQAHGCYHCGHPHIDGAPWYRYRGAGDKSLLAAWAQFCLPCHSSIDDATATWHAYQLPADTDPQHAPMYLKTTPKNDFTWMLIDQHGHFHHDNSQEQNT